LAHHWSRASTQVAEMDKAFDYAMRAGDRSTRQLANDEAILYYRQALDLLTASGRSEDDPDRVEVLISLGEAQRRAGDPAHRETLLEAARRARRRDDAEQSARAALANTRGGISSALGAVDLERIAALEAALDGLPV